MGNMRRSRRRRRSVRGRRPGPVQRRRYSPEPCHVCLAEIGDPRDHREVEVMDGAESVLVACHAACHAAGGPVPGKDVLPGYDKVWYDR